MDNKQVNINVSDLIPPKNVGTIDSDGFVGNAVSKEQYKTGLEELKTEIYQKVESDFQGTISPTSVAPTEDGSYKPEVSSEDNKTVDPNDWGTLYPNAGNLRAKSGYSTMFYKKGDVWTKSESKNDGIEAKKVYDPTDNVNAPTMNTASKHFEGYTETTSGGNYLDSNLSELSGSLPVNSEQTYIFKNLQSATQVFKNLNIKLGTAGKVQLEKYELINGQLERTGYQQFTNNLIAGSNPVVLNDNMQVYGPTEYFAVRVNTGSLLGRLSFKQITNPDYQYGIHIGNETVFAPPTWRNDYRLGVQLVGEVTDVRIKGAIETEIDRLVGKLVDINKLFSFFMDSVFSSLSKNLKPLTVIQIIGDSLNANAIGGIIPMIEALTERPMRLGEANNLARRIYDLLSWNKPLWRRLDHTAWTKSSGWSALNSTSFFEPVYDNEKYHSGTANSYAEITVPSGNENFATVLRQGNNSGAVSFTLNGQPMPSEIGIASFDTNLTDAGHTGNPYKVIQFNNLPPGQDNVIRITNSSTTPVYIWGGFYWSGTTMVVMNSAHGGHNLRDLIDQKHLADEVLRNDFDAYIFQLTEMNEMRLGSIDTSLGALQEVLDNYMKDKDAFFTSCNILGTDPTDGTPNYYKTDANGNPLAFTQKELNTAFKQLLYLNKIPFLDVFKVFEHHTLAKGGSLENGDAGKLFTLDGQHGSPLGVELWKNALVPFLQRTPISKDVADQLTESGLIGETTMYRFYDDFSTNKGWGPHPTYPITPVIADGIMTLSFTAGSNQAVILPLAGMEIGKKMTFKVVMKRTTSNGSILNMGLSIGTASNVTQYKLFSGTTEFQTYQFEITPVSGASTNLTIGMNQANNFGDTFVIDSFIVDEVTTMGVAEYINYLKTINTGYSEDLQTAVFAGNNVSLRPITYNMATSINVPSNTTIKGIKGRTIINYSGSGDFIDLAGKENIVFEDITFVGFSVITPAVIAAADVKALTGIGTQNCIVARNAIVKGIVFKNCKFYNFSGIAIDSSYTHIATETLKYADNIIIDGCTMVNNYMGLRLGPRSEYHRLIGNSIGYNKIGAWIEGGNNIATACHFNNNGVGVVTTGVTPSSNDTHGALVGCTINHNLGYSIFAFDVNVGFIFNGCHIHDGKIYIDNSKGLQIMDSQINAPIESVNESSGWNIISNNFFFTSAGGGTFTGTRDRISMNGNRFRDSSNHTSINNSI